MNMFSDVYERCRSGVVHLDFFKSRKRVAAGTGFMLGKKLVTNNHVYYVPNADYVLIRTIQHDPTNPMDGIQIPYSEFASRLLTGSPESKYDYAMLDIPQLSELNLYEFFVESRIRLSIGREYAILGFPLDHQNLTIHRGIVSSHYQRCGVDIIQLDASVNNGNSGGPLIELSDGGVVGIVTRKATGLTSAFQGLYSAFDRGIEAIQRNTSEMQIVLGYGYDPYKAAINNLCHLKQLCWEIERSANTGIGYAFSIRHLAEQFEVPRR